MPAALPRFDDLVRRHLGRDGVAGEGDRDVLGQQHLGRGGGEMLGGEAPVVGDDHALGLLAAVRRRSGPPRRRSAGRSRTCSRRRPFERQPSVPKTIFVGCGTWLIVVTNGPPALSTRRESGSIRALNACAPRSTAIGPVVSTIVASTPRAEVSRPDAKPDHEVGGSRLVRLAGRGDRRLDPGHAQLGQQRGPAAQVVPADVHRAHHDLARRGRRLHHRVVDRDRANPRVGPGVSDFDRQSPAATAPSHPARTARAPGGSRAAAT